MQDAIFPAAAGFMIGLPALVFTIVQWSKTWTRENRQIAATRMEAALREGHAVLNARLEFEKERRLESEGEKKELEEENTNLRAENFDLRFESGELRRENQRLRESQSILNDTLRVEERRITDDRD